MTKQEAFTLLGVYILGMVWIILNNIYDISFVLCPTKIPLVFLVLVVE